MTRKMIVGLLTFVAVLLVGCGGGVSLDEYAQELEQLVHEMNQRLDTATETQPASPTLDDVRAVWAERADARWDFLAAAADLNPPDSVTDLHETAFELITELATAETAMAEVAAQAQSLEELVELAAGPEAAFQAIDARAVAMCQAAQETFDATETGKALADTPFIPSEMTQVVEVAFRCTVAERQG